MLLHVPMIPVGLMLKLSLKFGAVLIVSSRLLLTSLVGEGNQARRCPATSVPDRFDVATNVPDRLDLGVGARNGIGVGAGVGAGVDASATMATMAQSTPNLAGGVMTGS